MAFSVGKACTLSPVTGQLARPGVPNACAPRITKARATHSCAASPKPEEALPAAMPGLQGRRAVLGAGLATALIQVPDAEALDPVTAATRQGEVRRSDEEWQKLLSPAQYRVLRKEATELPYSSPLNNEKRDGTFVCAGCGASLFTTNMKYNSGTGWPSFYEALPGATDELPDFSIPFLPRTEVRCHRCQGHLGHVFNDGPRPTGLRYCMNGAAMDFKPKDA